MNIKEIVFLPKFLEKLILKHDIEPYEIEEVFDNVPHIRFLEKGKIENENLYLAWGTTFDGRYLSIFFIYKISKKALIISARDMTLKERKSYGKVKKHKN